MTALLFSTIGIIFFPPDFRHVRFVFFYAVESIRSAVFLLYIQFVFSCLFFCREGKDKFLPGEKSERKFSFSVHQKIDLFSSQVKALTKIDMCATVDER